MSGFDDRIILANYAPADFQDSEETRPPESYLDSGSQAPATIYSSVITNTGNFHNRQIRDRHVMPTVYTGSWKRKVRDLFVQGSEAVLGWLAKPLASHPTLGQAELLIRRYSRSELTNREANSHMNLRDIVTDLSGEISTEFVERELDKSRDISGNISRFVAQTHALYMLYKEVLEEIALNDATMKEKLVTLDKIQPRLKMLLELGPMSESATLEASIERYMKEVFAANSPEAEYKKALRLYKKFLVVKDMIAMLRLSSSADREPICGICLNETVSFVLVPCGHTFCDTCSKRQIMQCYMCRQPSRERIKIYFT